MFDKRFSMAGCVELGSPMAFCLVYFLESIPLRYRRLQLTSAGFTARYCLFTTGYRPWSRLEMNKSGMILSIVTPFMRWDISWTYGI